MPDTILDICRQFENPSVNLTYPFLLIHHLSRNTGELSESARRSVLINVVVFRNNNEIKNIYFKYPWNKQKIVVWRLKDALPGRLLQASSSFSGSSLPSCCFKLEALQNRFICTFVERKKQPMTPKVRYSLYPHFLKPTHLKSRDTQLVFIHFKIGWQ